MRFFALFLLFLMPVCLVAQSKRIGFLSHSGLNVNLETALAYGSLFGTDASDFGAAPERIVRMARLDSLIALDDHRVIMVTSYVCSDSYRPSKASRIWKPGRDTVVDNEYLGRIHELDKVRQTINELYNFDKSKPVVFIGFDNILPQPPVQTPTPQVDPQQQQPIQYDPQQQPIQYDPQQQPIPYDPQQQPIQYDPQQMPEPRDSTKNKQLNGIPFNTGGPSDKTGAVALWLMVAFLVSLSVGAFSFLKRKRVIA
jgi:hypothetical protein